MECIDHNNRTLRALITDYSILVVDDVVEIRELICDFLKDHYSVVLHASSGLEALEVLKSSEVAMIISDINMPGMKGFDLLKEVKRLYPHIKRILMTAYNVEEYLELAIQYEVSNIFVKTTPFQFNELSILIEKLRNNNIFGISHYFGTDAVVQEIKIRSSRTLHDEATKIVNFFQHESESNRLQLVVVELLTNALFYGVRGEDPDKKELWDHDFVLSDDAAVNVTIVRDTVKYGISVGDNGGKLKREDVLYWLNRQITRDKDGLPLGLYDTHGRGLFIARKYIDRLIVNIDQDRKTEIIVINYFSKDIAGFKPLYINEI
jgi:CheY-like chemotaxis protein